MKYSVTIPVYKATFFRECLESVLFQTYDDYEIVILNDCSPENIKGIVEGFYSHKNAEKIRYYENEKNVGAVDLVDNWNKLLELANGEYLICMGDDDKLAPNCLEQYNFLMDKYPDLDVYHVRSYIIDEDSEVINIQESRPERESAYSMIWHIMYKNRSQFIGDFLFSKSKLQKSGGFVKFPLALASDYVTTFLLAKEKGIGNCDTAVFYYRTSQKTITSNADGKILITATMSYKEWIKSFIKQEPAYGDDEIYRKQIEKNLENYFNRKVIDNVATNLATTYFSTFFYWFFRKKKLGLSLQSIFYAFILGWFRFFKKI